MQEDKDKLVKDHAEVSVENKGLLKGQQELEEKYNKEKEFADKMRSNYEILKEHEMNIIKDYEGKKTKEFAFYDQTISDLNK